ncbi:MAG: glycosyltransferase [Cellvibrionaceae bacterium]
MRIAIVSKSDRNGGGASKVAEDLCDLLRQQGHFVSHYMSETPEYISSEYQVHGSLGSFAKKANAWFRKIGFQELIPFEYFYLKKRIKINKYDLIHFHDLTWSISPLTLRLLSRKIPVFWTLHDCSPFTGGCIYPLDCTKYQTDCNDCPQRGQPPLPKGKYDLANIELKIKRFVHKADLTLIAPSQWSKQFAATTSIDHKPINVISNGIDLDSYQLIDKAEAKQTAGVPQDRFCIIIIAKYLWDKKKGAFYALQTLKALKAKGVDPYLILVGELGPLTEKMFAKFDYLKTGFVSDYKDLNRLYAAADVFLNCSLGETFSLVTLEAAASGTPTVGFNVGALQELVVQNETGYLGEVKDISGLADKIVSLSQSNECIAWGGNARARAEKYYTKQHFIDKHIALYDSKVLTS